MLALREAFEALGYTDVATYIQSGNVIFSAKASKTVLTKAIETALDEAFAYESKVVVLSARDLEAVIEEAPDGFGRDPARYRYDTLFVKPPVTARAALRDVEITPGVDDVHAGRHALYFRRVIAKATKSRLSKLVQKPVYKNLTIRNWNTTKKLFAMTR